MNSFLMKSKNLSGIELRERKRNSDFSRFSKTWPLERRRRSRRCCCGRSKCPRSKSSDGPSPTEQDLDDQYLADEVQKAKLKRIKVRQVFCLFPKKINFYPQTPIFSVLAKMSGIARSICRSSG